MLDKFESWLTDGVQFTLGGMFVIGVVAITCWTRFKSLIKVSAKCEAESAVHEQHMKCQLEYSNKFTEMEGSIKYIEREIGKLSGNPRKQDGVDNE